MTTASFFQIWIFLFLFSWLTCLTTLLSLLGEISTRQFVSSGLIFGLISFGTTVFVYAVTIIFVNKD